MVLVGYGNFRGLISGEKNGRPYCLLDMGAADYRPLTVFVPDDLRGTVKGLSEGDPIGVEVTAESVFGKGTQMTLKSLQMKK